MSGFVVEIIEQKNQVIIEELANELELISGEYQEVVIVEGIYVVGGAVEGNEFGEIRLIPKPSSQGLEGTMFYCSDDDHVYVATE